jgi:hypothetical protein
LLGCQSMAAVDTELCSGRKIRVAFCTNHNKVLLYKKNKCFVQNRAHSVKIDQIKYL